MSIKDEWIEKLWCRYSMEYYSTIKIVKNPTICDKIHGLKGCMLSEENQTEKGKYHMISPICEI